LVAAHALAPAGQPKYGVSVKDSRPAALATVKTYRWTETHPSFHKTINAQIIAAVDLELQARGLKKLDSGPSDLVVTYRSLSRTDVNLKAKAGPSGPPELGVGTLVVDLRDSANRASLFRVQMDTPIDNDPAKLDQTIKAAVAAMFEKYPRAAKR
jgi:hypothetical protein